MPRRIEGTWIICGVASEEGSQLSYAALPLSESLRQSLRKMLAAWKAADDVFGGKLSGMYMEFHEGPVYWMEGLPDCLDDDFRDEIDRNDWVQIPLSPMEELALLSAGEPGEPTRDDILKRQDDSIDRALARTEYERILVSSERGVYFKAHERHGDAESWTNSLPDWVIDWVMGEVAE